MRAVRAVRAGAVRRALAVALLGAACVPAPRASTTPSATPSTPTPAAVDPWAGRTDLLAAPTPPEIAAPVAPAARTRALPNGLTVRVEDSPSSPLARVTLILPGGEAQAPAARPELAHVAARALLGVAGRRSGRDVAAAAEALGGRLWSVARIDSIELGCEVLPVDADQCLVLLGELARATTLPPEIVDAALRVPVPPPTSGAFVARTRARARALGEGGATGGPSPAAEVTAWARARLDPAGATLLVRAPDRGAPLDRTITTAFSSWRRGPATPATSGTTTPAGAAEVVDAALTRPRVALAALVHRGDDWTSTRVALAALAIVADAAGARDVSFDLDPGVELGLATLTFGLDRADAATLAQVLNHLSAGLNDLDPALLAAAQARASLEPATTPPPTPPPATPTPAPTVAPASLPTSQPTAPAISESVRLAASRLAPARVAVVVVGDAATLSSGLAAAGLAPTRTALTLAVADGAIATPAQRVAGRRLLEEALAAHGGAARVGAIKAVLQRGRVTLISRGQSVTGTFERIVAPGRGLRIDFSLPIGAIGYLATPTKAWVTSGGRIVPLDGAELTAQERALWRERTTLLVRHRDPSVEVWAAGTVKEGAATLDAVVVRAPDGAETRLLIDTRSHRLVGTDVDEDGVRSVERYGDYRPVAGMWIPHLVTAEQPDQRIEAVITETRLDPELPEGTFEEPAP